MEEITEIKTPDVKYSKSECLKYQGVTVFNENLNEPCNGEYIIDGTVKRFKNGLLNSLNDLPAYETNTGHSEYFKNGLLHRENGPAVISNFGNWEEWWYNGTFILIKIFGEIEKEIELYKEE